MMTGSLKNKNKNKKIKKGCSVIRACSLIRSNTVVTGSCRQPANMKEILNLLVLTSGMVLF